MQDFTDRTLRQFKRLIRAEGDRATPGAESSAMGQQIAFVRITGAAVSGYYPGRVELYASGGATWDQFGTVWCKATIGTIDPADATVLYLGLRFDEFNNGGDRRPVFQLVGKFAALADLIDISGRTGSVVNVTAATFQRTVVTGAAGSTVVTPDDASATLPGDVNLVDGQKMGLGRKDFDGVGFLSGTVDYELEPADTTYPGSLVFRRLGSTFGPSMVFRFGGVLQVNSSDELTHGQFYSSNSSAVIGVASSDGLYVGLTSTPPPMVGINKLAVCNEFWGVGFSADTDGTYANRAPGVTGTGGGGDTFRAGLCTTLGTTSTVDGGTF